MYRTIDNIYKSSYINAEHKLRKPTVLQRNLKEGKIKGVNFVNVSY